MTETATIPQLLTYQGICDKALDMLIEKVGELPVKPEFYDQECKYGSAVIGGDPFKCGYEIILKQPIMGRSLDPAELTKLGDGCLSLDLEEFAAKYLTAQIDNLASAIRAECASFNKAIIFAKMKIPNNTMWAGFAQQSGLWLRLVVAYLIEANCPVMRFDVLYGGI